MTQEITISYEVVDRGGDKMVLITEGPYQVLTDYVPDLPGYYIPRNYVDIGQRIDGKAQVIRSGKIVASGALFNSGGMSDIDYISFFEKLDPSVFLPFDGRDQQIKVLDPKKFQVGDRLEYTISSDKPFRENLPVPFYLRTMVQSYEHKRGARLHTMPTNKVPTPLCTHFQTPVILNDQNRSAVLLHRLMDHALRIERCIPESECAPPPKDDWSDVQLPVVLTGTNPFPG